MASLIVTPENRGAAIKAAGDIVGGWQSARDGYGFFGLGFLDYPGDIRARVTLQVRARPNNLARQFARDFPDKHASHRSDGGLCYALNGSRIEVTADLASEVKWLPVSQRWGVYWHPDDPVAAAGRLRFYLQFLVVFSEPATKRVGDTWEHDVLPFLAGGQVESNRRRH